MTFRLKSGLGAIFSILAFTGLCFALVEREVPTGAESETVSKKATRGPAFAGVREIVVRE